MTAPQPPDHDENGDPLPAVSASSDVGQLIYLLEWARLRGFRLGPTLQVGGLIVQVSDLRQTEGRRGPSEPHDEGPWKAAGYEE